MEEVRNNLTTTDRVFLSDLWQDKDRLRALNNALSHRQLWLAQDCVKAPDYNYVMKVRGQVEEGTWFLKFLKFNFNECQKSKSQK